MCTAGVYVELQGVVVCVYVRMLLCQPDMHFLIAVHMEDLCVNVLKKQIIAF